MRLIYFLRTRISQLRENYTIIVFVLLVTSCGASNLQGNVLLNAVYLEEEDRGQEQFDLDTGGFNEQGGGDLRFTSGHGSMEFLALDPENGALARSVGLLKATIDDCKTILDGAPEGSVPEIGPGTYICVLTTQGNISRVRVENLYPGVHDDRIEISYVTWFSSDE